MKSMSAILAEKEVAKQEGYQRRLAEAHVSLSNRIKSAKEQIESLQKAIDEGEEQLGAIMALDGKEIENPEVVDEAVNDSYNIKFPF